MGRTKKTFTMYLHPERNFREFVVNGKQPLFPRMSRCGDLIELVCIYSAEDMKLILRIFVIIIVTESTTCAARRVVLMVLEAMWFWMGLEERNDRPSSMKR